MDDVPKWPLRSAKDAFIQFCLMLDIGQTTEELEAEWQAYCASQEKAVHHDQE